MATYTELYALSNDAALLERVSTAIAIAAYGISTESAATPYHAERKKWAREAMRSVDYTAKQVIWALLAQYASSTAAQIQSATDAQLLTAVENVLSLIAEV